MPLTHKHSIVGSGRQVNFQLLSVASSYVFRSPIIEACQFMTDQEIGLPSMSKRIAVIKPVG